MIALSAAAAVLLLAAGCGSGSGSSSSLSSIEITSSNAELRLGSSQQYTATGKFPDGTSRDVTSSVSWSSSEPDVVFINNQNGRNGFATGVGEGTSTITASEGGVQATATLTVSNPMPRFAYVSPAQHGDGIEIYTEGSDGSLTPVPGSPFQLAGGNDMTIDPEGKFLFTTEDIGVLQSQFTVNSYAVDHATGVFASPAVSTLCCNDGFFNFLLAPSERIVYVNNSQSIAAISIDTAAKLALVGSTPVKVGSASADAINIAMEPAGKFIYAAIVVPPSVGMFTVQPANGMLTQQGTVPITGPAPDFLLLDRTGQFLYAMHPSNDMQSFRINGATGGLTSMGTTQTRGYPSAGAAHPSGRWIYVGMCCNGTPSVSGFSIDSATGNLTEVTNIATAGGGEPVNVVTEPTGKFLYVEENFGTDIFSIDPKSGALTLVSRQALSTPSYFTF